MNAFTDVTLTQKANIYFDGNVTSRSFVLADGSKKSLGIMLPGEYEFSTGAKEIMEILSGELEILLPGAKNWKTINGGESFEVPAQSSFGLKVKTVVDYCCSYLD